MATQHFHKGNVVEEQASGPDRRVLPALRTPGWAPTRGPGGRKHTGDRAGPRMLARARLGVRYELTKSYPKHIRLDYVWGRDGPLFYFGVSEAY